MLLLFGGVAYGTYTLSTPSGQNALNDMGTALNEAGQEIYDTTTSIIHKVKTKSEALTDSDATTISISNTNKKKNDYSVYLLYDPQTQLIEYVGRTKNLFMRQARHKLSTNRGHLKMLPIAQNLSYEASREMEELGINYYNTYIPAVGNAPKLNNQIHGIRPNNPRRSTYLTAAQPYKQNLTNIMSNNPDNVILKKR